MESKFFSLPQNTLLQVEEFVASQMHPTNELTRSMVATTSRQGQQTRTKYIPKFTVDGYGRWREVNCPVDGQKDLGEVETKNNFPNEVVGGLDFRSENDRGFRHHIPQTSINTSRSKYSHISLTKNDHNLQSRKESIEAPGTGGTPRGYNNLSSSLRYNVFPGVGKSQWESSMKEAFVPKSIPSQWLEPRADYAVKKDAYMKWAEYDVYRQKLMKAWDKYIADGPKTERQAPAKVTKESRKKEKVEENKTKKKVKPKKEKPVAKQGDKEAEPAKSSEPQPTRIEVQPAKSDDSFWDFYEKPLENHID